MEKRNKLKSVLSVCTVLLGAVVFVESVFAKPYLPNPFGLTLIITGAAVFMLSIAIAIALDYSSGDYECRRCGHRFVPTLGAYILGVHTASKRYLKCPKCGKKSFCKRKLS